MFIIGVTINDIAGFGKIKDYAYMSCLWDEKIKIKIM